MFNARADGEGKGRVWHFLQPTARTLEGVLTSLFATSKSICWVIPRHYRMNGSSRVFVFLCLWCPLIFPVYITHMYAHLWLRVTGTVNLMCTVGKWCLSGPPEKGRAWVKTLIGREKPSCITVELCPRTGEIKGRERGEPVRKTGAHTHTHARAGVRGRGGKSHPATRR